MERLTESGVNIGFLNSNKLPNYESVYERLKDYEDYEEQGLLLRNLVGGIIYKINPLAKEIVDCTVTSMFLTCSMNGNANYTAETNTRHYQITFRKSDIGKTVFLTQEEAEQKLKEMESD